MTGDMVQPFKTEKPPLHRQVQQYLLTLIEQGTYQPGEQLPSEVDLAAQLGVSRPTLREALYILEQEGVIVRKHGVGTFVASGYSSRLESGLERLESLLTWAARRGLDVQIRDLSVDAVEAKNELAERLDIEQGMLLTHVRRTLLVEDDPVAYLEDFVPSEILPVEQVDDTFTGSVLDLLMQQQSPDVRKGLVEITALSADQSLALRLGTQAGRAILLLKETLFDDKHTPIGFSYNYFVPDRFRFWLVRSRNPSEE